MEYVGIKKVSMISNQRWLSNMTEWRAGYAAHAITACDGRLQR